MQRIVKGNKLHHINPMEFDTSKYSHVVYYDRDELFQLFNHGHNLFSFVSAKDMARGVQMTPKPITSLLELVTQNYKVYCFDDILTYANWTQHQVNTKGLVDFSFYDHHWVGRITTEECTDISCVFISDNDIVGTYDPSTKKVYRMEDMYTVGNTEYTFRDEFDNSQSMSYETIQELLEITIDKHDVYKFKNFKEYVQWCHEIL